MSLLSHYPQGRVIGLDSGTDTYYISIMNLQRCDDIQRYPCKVCFHYISLVMLEEEGSGNWKFMQLQYCYSKNKNYSKNRDLLDIKNLKSRTEKSGICKL